MKKSYIITAIVEVMIGICCLLAALFMNSRLDSLLCGFAGAGIGTGCYMIYKYVYWTDPKRRKEYDEKLQQEQIELHDELKEKVRDKAGRYAYVLGLVIIGISIPVFVMLDKLQIIKSSSILIFFLFFYLIFQYVSGIVIFKHLLKKFQ